MENDRGDIIVRYARESDVQYAGKIVKEMELSALARGTGIARRSPEEIEKKILEGRAVIAVSSNGEWVGFIYMDVWNNGKFISHHGLIVSPQWRRQGIATLLKKEVFNLSRLTFPGAGIFGITSTLATMKINSKLGLLPVTFSEIVQDLLFWNKCSSCVHYKDLQAAGYKNCFCTAMLYTPAVEGEVLPADHFKITGLPFQNDSIPVNAHLSDKVCNAGL